MTSRQNTHRKVVFQRSISKIFTGLPCLLLLSKTYFTILLCLFSTPASLSIQNPSSGLGYLDANKIVSAKFNINGLLPLRNIRMPEVLVASKKLLPKRKRRRRTGSSDYCRPDNFREFVLNISSDEASSSKEDVLSASKPQAYVYAITQDCQIIFARAEQMHQIGKMVEVDNRLTYCLPGLVQLHWRETETGGIGLQLLLKRTNRQICTLPVEFPQANSLLGSTIFSYSLRSSLNYAVCSFMSNSSFVMEPELSFMDTTYSDVVYFVDPNSSGAYWTVRQFKLDERGYFKALDTFIVRNIAEQDSKHTGRPQKAAEYFISLDAQRKKFFAVHKQRKSVVSTCAYDLLFRPHRAKVERSSLVPFEASSENLRLSQYSDQNYNEVTSFSVDHSAMMYAEVFRKADDKYSTKLFITNKLSNQSSPNCVLEVPFRAKFGFITTQSLEQLNEIQLPKFSAAQMKSHKSSKSKDRFTTTTISPKHKPRHGLYTGERSSAELIQDQLLPSTSTKTLLPTTTMSSRFRGKSSITTIILVRPTTTTASKSSYTTKRPTTTRSRFQAQSTEGSGFNTNSEEGQLLTPTSFKEVQQKGRIDTPKQQQADSMDESFPAGYSDYENNEEDDGFHGGGDNPLGLIKTDERKENSKGVTTNRWQNTRIGWPSTATTAKPTEKEKANKPAAQPNTFMDKGEPSSSFKFEFGLHVKRIEMLVISSLITVDIVFSLLFL